MCGRKYTKKIGNMQMAFTDYNFFDLKAAG